MKAFNSEKELRKIQKGNKNKIILFVISLLIVSVISYSFALYQVRYSKRIIYTKVAPFSNHDIDLAVYLDNEPNPDNDFPTKDQNYVYDKIECENNSDNHVVAYWDYDKWALVVEANKKAKCNVYFKTGTDRSGANAPELYQGLIPVTIDDDGIVKVADLEKEWYSYENHEWANAVLIDDENSHSKYYKDDGSFNVGATMDLENDILQMYVWIPRYKYQLFNAVVGGVKEEEMINIKFEKDIQSTGTAKCEIANNGIETCMGAENGSWYTHPAFTFGNTELTGIWVGKFETSHITKSKGNSQNIDTNAVLGCVNNNCLEADNLRVLPNQISLRYNNLSNFFYASQSLMRIGNPYNLNNDEVDTHMMKNIEWGAVAYLTQSKYGRCSIDGECTEVTNNNNSNYTTGCGADSIGAAATTECNNWVTERGKSASTTNNQYGIYDLSGGGFEGVMAKMYPSGGGNDQSGFTTYPDQKYYDLYKYVASESDISGGHLGDATREIMKTYSGTCYERTQWYGDGVCSPFSAVLFLIRGSYYIEGSGAGIFKGSYWYGSAHFYSTFRPTITAHDGNT